MSDDVICDNPKCRECRDLRLEYPNQEYIIKPAIAKTRKLHSSQKQEVEKIIKSYQEVVLEVSFLKGQFKALNDAKNKLFDKFDKIDQNIWDEKKLPVCQRLYGLWDDEFRGKEYFEASKTILKWKHEIERLLVDLDKSQSDNSGNSDLSGGHN